MLSGSTNNTSLCHIRRARRKIRVILSEL